jgi:hypothetical protein
MAVSCVADRRSRWNRVRLTLWTASAVHANGARDTHIHNFAWNTGQRVSALGSRTATTRLFG